MIKELLLNAISWNSLKKIILPNLKKKKRKEDIAMPSLHAQKPFLYQIESHSNFRVQLGHTLLATHFVNFLTTPIILDNGGSKNFFQGSLKNLN